MNAETKFVLLTNVKVNGETIDEGDDNVLIISALDAETVKLAYQNSAITYDECYEVPENDVQYYIFQPCHLSKNQEKAARQRAELLMAK